MPRPSRTPRSPVRPPFDWLNSRWTVGFALLAVLVVKFITLIQLADHPLLQPHGVLDDAVYLKLAQRVAAGDLALGPDVYYLSPFYTYFLGAILASGGSVSAARGIQCLLGVAAVFLVGATSRRWFGTRAGWIAGGAAALTGLFTFNEILLLQSSVDPFLAALALWAMARAFDDGRPASFLGAGAALGLLVVNRPNALAAVVVVGAVWLVLRRSRTALVELAALGVGVAILVAPVAVRNRVVAGEWTLVTSHGGLNFYIGNHEGADGTWSALPGISPSIEGQSRDAIRVASTALGAPVTAGEASRYYYRLGRQWIDRMAGIENSPFKTVRQLIIYSYTFYNNTKLGSVKIIQDLMNTRVNCPLQKIFFDKMFDRHIIGNVELFIGAKYQVNSRY